MLVGGRRAFFISQLFRPKMSISFGKFCSSCKFDSFFSVLTNCLSFYPDCLQSSSSYKQTFSSLRKEEDKKKASDRVGLTKEEKKGIRKKKRENRFGKKNSDRS